MSNIQIGGKLGRNGRPRIERPYSGVIAGLSINRLRVLDLASERDPHITIRGDVQLVTGVLDRNDLQRMQQVRYLKIMWKAKCKIKRNNKKTIFNIKIYYSFFIAFGASAFA
jgi:hypothetical protein